MVRCARLLLSILLLSSVFSAPLRAANFYVWVWIDPAADTHNWEHKDFKKAVKAGFALYEAECGLRFVFTGQKSEADIVVLTSELYGGKTSEGMHIHYRGLFTPATSFTKPTLRLSNGEISAGQGNAQPGAYQWTPFTSASGLSHILAHEYGHKLGWTHSGDSRCLMSPGVGPSFCSHESADLRVWFPGRPKRLAAGESFYFYATPISEEDYP